MVFGRARRRREEWFEEVEGRLPAQRPLRCGYRRKPTCCFLRKVTMFWTGILFLLVPSGRASAQSVAPSPERAAIAQRITQTVHDYIDATMRLDLEGIVGRPT